MDKSPKIKKAAALKYDLEQDSAPILTAVGQGATADNMLRIAEENEIPVVEDESTAELLAKLSVGDAIPPALYEAVAQILIFISDLDSRANKNLL